MNKKQKLEKKWWIICQNWEDKIEDAASIGDGLFFLLFLPVWFVLKTMQWVSWNIGCWIIRLLPISKQDTNH